MALLMPALGIGPIALSALRQQVVIHDRSGASLAEDSALKAAEETVRLLLKSRAGSCARLVADAAVSHGLDASRRARLEGVFAAQIHAERIQAQLTAERNARADERIVQAVHRGYYAVRRVVIAVVVIALALLGFVRLLQR